MTEQDRRISEIVAEQRSLLRNFIRRRVPNPSDAEERHQLAFSCGTQSLYFRNVLHDELQLAIDELPDDQRHVFVAHELEGRSAASRRWLRRPA
jgi:DNA-directed RNA polymerase specialized sigma24 family protein